MPTTQPTSFDASNPASSNSNSTPHSQSTPSSSQLKRKRSMASSRPISISSSPETQPRTIRDFFQSSQDPKRARPNNSDRSDSLELLGQNTVSNTQDTAIDLGDDSDVAMSEVGGATIDLTDSPQPPSSRGKGKERESVTSLDQKQETSTPSPFSSSSRPSSTPGRTSSHISMSPGIPPTSSAAKSSSVSTPPPPPPPQDTRKQSGLRIGMQPRKLLVKNLKIRDKESGVGGTEYFNKTWATLDAALTRIFSGSFSTNSMEGLYRSVESLCRAKRAPEVHQNLKARMTKHVKKDIKDEVSKQALSDPDRLVPVVEREWRKWSDKLTTIRSIFSFLNQSYLLANKMPSLWDTGLSLFSSEVLDIGKESGVGASFMVGLSNLFLAERTNTNQAGNLQIMMASLGMIKNLDIYRVFEATFLQLSSKWFSLRAQEKIKEGSLRNYVSTCSGLFVSEADLCAKFSLGSITKRRLYHEIETRFVMDRESKIFILGEERITGLLADCDIDSLKKLYDMLQKVENPAPYLKPAWESYITETGKGIILDKEHEDTMVYRLLRLKGQLDEVEAKSFRKDELLAYALREKFASFVNMSRPGDKNADTVPRLLAKYCDMLMRRGLKALAEFEQGGASQDGEDGATAKILTQGAGDQEAGLERQFEACLDLFRFLAGKDVFEAFYKKDLAKRLLLSKSASLDSERSMMTKLKTECGSGFTHNMECMFKDIELSKEMVRAFKATKYGIPLKEAKLDLTVDVLSMSAWPTYPDTPITVPEDIQKLLDSFAEYYLANHNGRKVMWRHAVGHCMLTAKFNTSRKELILSIFQAVVLLQFNDIPSETTPISYTALQAATSLPEADLKRTLQSLACGKYRVLRKSPKGRDVNDSDQFFFNGRFENPRARIKINQIQLKETVQEKEQTMERVKVDRQFEIQAAVCRVMKSKRKMKGVDLITNVVDLCKGRGVLEGKEIRDGIRRLCEKDYIEETSEGSDEYVYVT